MVGDSNRESGNLAAAGSDFPTFEDLLLAARRGNPEAQGQYRSYVEHLTRSVQRLNGVVRRKLRYYVGGRISESDVVQSALVSYFSHHAVHVDPTDEGSVWDKLLEIALRHCDKWKKRIERHPESSLDVVASSHGAGLEDSASNEVPVEVIMFAETVQRLLSGLAEQDRRYAQLIIEGWTDGEVGDQFEVAKRIVHRVRRTLQQRIQRELERTHGGCQ